MPVVLSPRRDVNWCSLFGEPQDCFPHDEACFRFDSSKVNLPALLVMSGAFPTYLSAVAAGYRGKVEYGWSYVEHNNVICYFWNPDPSWEQSPEPADMTGERDFFHPTDNGDPPWFETEEAWEDGVSTPLDPKPEGWDENLMFDGAFGS